jgi:hypothetical protein
LWQRVSIPLIGRLGEIGSSSYNDGLVRFYAPSDGLSGDYPKRLCGKRQRMARIALGDPHHFTDLDDDFGERKSAFLLRRYLRSDGSTKRVDEGEEPFVVPGNEIIG